MKRIYKKKMRGSDFEFDGVNFLYYDFNKNLRWILHRFSKMVKR